MNHIPYVIALYIRLSVEDAKVESMSVENQKKALHQFVDTTPGLEDVEVLEFIDNGYSGTSFERPAIQKLLNLVQKGAVNCIAVKDFSRFGRSSVEVEYYLERVFPLYNIRFISINDDYDSDRLHGDTGGINVAFRYLINELYSKDLSVKYKSAKFTKFQRGEYQSKICPYGYKKGNNGRMEPDEEAADTVRLIFKLAQSGLGAKGIVKELYACGIPTPAEYKAAHGFKGHDISRCHGIWSESTVAHILADERYIGTYVIGKREVTEVGRHRVRLKAESEWIRIPEHHPAIIGKELFDDVQAQRPHTVCARKNINVYPLRGKVFCGNCGHAMPRTSNKNHAYICRHSRADETAACYGLRILETDLERIVYDIILAEVQVSPEGYTPPALDDLAARITVCQTVKRKLYEQFVEQEISLDDYKMRKAGLDSELTQLQQTKSVSEARAAQAQTAIDQTDLLRRLREADHLTVELVDKLLDRVEVYPDNRVELKRKFLP